MNTDSTKPFYLCLSVFIYWPKILLSVFRYGSFLSAGTTNGSCRSGGDLGDFEYQEGAAIATDHDAVLGRVDGIRSTPGAFRGGVRGTGQRIGRDDAGDGAALQSGGWFEGGSAIRADVVVAAVGGTTVEHIGGAALRAGNRQLVGLDHGLSSLDPFGVRPKSGSITTVVVDLRLSTNLRLASVPTVFSSSGRSSSKVLVGFLSSTRMR